jgi:hypothetical protein
MSEYGARGTNSIITDADVKLAYDIALSVAEATYLRTSSGDIDLTDHDNVDVAELIAFRNGIVEIDLGAVMAQTLVGILDDLVISWMEYLLIYKILDVIEAISDALKNAWNWLCKAITGSESETAQGYLSSTMSNHGIPESEYRYMWNGSTANIRVSDAEYEIGDDIIDLSGLVIKFEFPNVDVLKWRGWDGFMKKYRSEHNQIREAVSGTINSIAAGIANSYGLGVLRVQCDPYDEKSFAETMADAVKEALDRHKNDVEDRMESTIRSGKVADTLYATIYETMVGGRDELFGVDALKNNMRNAVKTSVTERIKKEYGIPLDPSVIDEITDDIMRCDSALFWIEVYEDEVNDRLQMFADVLNSIEKNTKSVFKDIIVILMRYGIDRLGLYPLLEYKMMKLISETAEVASTNPLAGVYELPGTDVFELNGSGGYMKEYVSLECDVSLDVKIVSPTKGDENMHYIGFGEDHEASYSSVFRIFVTADLTYVATSASPIMNMLGSYDAMVTGTSHSEFDIAVAVMSGWALAGVNYTSSRTILDDIVMVFMKIIEPLLGPLYELIKLGKSVLHVVTNALMRAAGFVSDLVMKLYDIIMGPLQLFGELVSNILGKIFEQIITTMVLTLNSQTFGFNLFGMRLEVITDLVGELRNHASTTKIRLTMPIFGVKLSATLDVRKDKSSNFFFSGSISAEAETWDLNIVLDPLMKTKKHMVELNGTFRGTDIHAVMPQAVQYEKLEFRLSDVPGVGEILQNIPLPIPGMKGSLDAGVELKYNAPYIYGVVINEFELNPEGEDRDNEWVELYNSTRSSVNLDGYTLIPTSNLSKTYTIKDTVISPGEHLVITFPGQFLNNSKESIGLYDADGIQVDCTPMKSDAKNDDQTWQRETDASAKWVFKKGTKGEDNGGKYMGGSPMRAAIAQCVLDASTQAFSEMGLKIVGPDGVALFLKRVVELTIEKAIDMIANSVVSASIFIEIAISDASGSLHAGIRFSLMLDRDIIRDGLRWAVGQIIGMMNNIDNPTGMTPKQIISDDIYFQTMVFAQVTAPKILGSTMGGRGVTVGVVVGCNITALCNLIGRPGGTWRVNIGLVFEDIPAYIVPPMIKIDSDKHTDLWLFRMTLERSKS